MNPSTPLPPDPAPSDPDLAEQACPGHGVPSQDPSPAAQHALTVEEAKREADAAMAGGGAAGGAAIGATIGVAVAGPVGVLVGGTLGAVAGAVGGAAAGTMVSPDESKVPDRTRGGAVRPDEGGDTPAGDAKR